MELTSKQKDDIKLRVDNIFHQRLILTNDNKNVMPNNIVLRIVNKEDKVIIIISAIPTPNEKYKCDNKTWYRLNASNYLLREERMVPYANVQAMICQEVKKTNDEFKPLIDAQNSHIKKIEEDLKRAHRKMKYNSEESERRIKQLIYDTEKSKKHIEENKVTMKSLEIEYSNMIDLVHQNILINKNNMERKLYKEKSESVFNIFC
jgi:hypothetical protein